MSVDTIYPFGDTLVYTITARSSFDFYIRIPSWTVLALSSISVDGKKAGALTPDENSLQKVAVKSGKTTVKVKLGMEVNVVTRGSGGVAVYRGPLLYALDLEYSSESFQPLNWTDTQPLPGEEVPPTPFLSPHSLNLYILIPHIRRPSPKRVIISSRHRANGASQSTPQTSPSMTTPQASRWPTCPALSLGAGPRPSVSLLPHARWRGM